LESFTNAQIKDFEVNGRMIRMDSKLIGSNIALYSRYDIILQTLRLFCKSVKDDIKLTGLSTQDQDQLNQLISEEPQKPVYRSTRDEIKIRLQPIGILIYKAIRR
jgi:hypothetical protein